MCLVVGMSPCVDREQSREQSFIFPQLVHARMDVQILTQNIAAGGSGSHSLHYIQRQIAIARILFTVEGQGASYM